MASISTNDKRPSNNSQGLTRRDFLWSSLGGVILGISGWAAWQSNTRRRLLWPGPADQYIQQADVFIGRAENYQRNIAGLIINGLNEVGITAAQVKGKKILLKPKLVEARLGAHHINTHPMVVRGAIEAFLHLGAAKIWVAEGPGHRRDTLLVLEESGLTEVLFEDHIPFVDLNYESGYTVPNRLNFSSLSRLTFPLIVRQADWIVSLAKMKTHHLAGVTLSMKNLFGLMPGLYYGWPKNILHWAGIDESIIDINGTLSPKFAIVDGIVGMEGDGPIMGSPKPSGVVVMGANLPAVDATCARIMGINPYRINYLAAVEDRLGPIAEPKISQRGESLQAVQTEFALVESIPAHRSLKY
jgi:uncharacterized protein (DUF362 family)